MATDTDLVLAVIRGVARCAICIARETGLTPFGVLGALARIGPTVVVTDAVRQCEGCSQVTGTHRA